MKTTGGCKGQQEYPNNKVIPNKCRLSFYFLTDGRAGFSILILGIIASAFGFGFVIYWIQPAGGLHVTVKPPAARLSGRRAGLER